MNQDKVNGVKMKKIFKIGIVSTAICSVLFLTGCGASLRSKNIQKQVTHTSDKVLHNHYKKLNHESKATFKTSDNSYFAKKPLNVLSGDKKVKLPPVLKKHVVINQPSKIKLKNLLAKITQLTGVFFTIDNGVYYVGQNSGSGFNANNNQINNGNNKNNSSKNGKLNPPPIKAGKPAYSNSSNSGNQMSRSNNARKKMSQNVYINSLVYKGKLSSLLNIIAGKLNVNWKWVGNKVKFYALDTKTFNVVALPGTTKTQSKINATSTTGRSGGGGGGSGGSSRRRGGTKGNSGDKTTFQTSSNVWNDLKKTLSGIISRYGRVNYIPSIGQITVTDTPSKLKAVKKVVDDFNKSFSKQVVINIEVLSVSMTGQDHYGISWNLIGKKLGSGFKVNYNAAGPTSGNILKFMFNNKNSKMSGSKAIVNALSSIGNTSIVSNASLMTLNGQPVPLQVTKEIAYAASTRTSLNQTTSATQIQPGVVQEGFTVNMTPRITNSKQVLLQYSLNLSQVVKIATFGKGANQVQLPTRNVRSFLQRVSLQSGETLVLAGFKQLNSNRKKKGTGSPAFWPFGGSKNNKNKNTQLVVLITPYVVDQNQNGS